jgi:DNA modification methylase
MIKNRDALLFLKDQADYSADLIFQDPPYALGSEIIIKPDGKVDYSKASDFMSKWEMPTGQFWEDYLKEAFRTLKYGGHCIMFGLDRQLLLFKYYAALAGFTEKQSLYWFVISSFPKASDLSKNIDKNAGAEREVVGVSENTRDRTKHDANTILTGQNVKGWNETKNKTPLAKKYSGYKYSIAPLKQTNETIMVFQKPYKTGSCLHDTLKMEKGNKKITCGALAIDGNRCETSDETGRKNKTDVKDTNTVGDWGMKAIDTTGLHNGRYPAQTYVNSQAGEKLGEASKVLHKCDFEKEEHDLYFYCPKVSKSERNAGCEEMEEKVTKVTNMYEMERTDGTIRELAKKKNFHPTVKPIFLNHKILSLFKTPNEQRLLIPFAGSGSEIIGAIKAGYTNIEGCEINESFIKIAEARISYWTNKFKEENKQTKLL